MSNVVTAITGNCSCDNPDGLAYPWLGPDDHDYARGDVAAGFFWQADLKLGNLDDTIWAGLSYIGSATVNGAHTHYALMKIGL